jgi:serine/threonine protein kinase
MKKKIGRYEVVEELGRGAMGVVYKSYDPVIDRILAIKLIKLDSNSFAVDQEEIKQRFLREARSAGTLSHPNIVTIYDVGEDRNEAYIAMEFIDGKTLSHIIEEGKRLDYTAILNIFAQIADALDYAHKKGIIHRDIKPANIMLTREGRVKLCDFGIAKIKSSAHTTQTGIIMGTPFYMSPEQIKAEKIDGRSDIFSLGIVLYELLSGDIPFKGETTSILYKIVHEDPPAPKLITKDLPKFYETVILKSLAKKVEDRYRTCSELAAALKRYESKYLKKKKKSKADIDEEAKTVLISEANEYSINESEDTAVIEDEYKPLTEGKDVAVAKARSLRIMILGLLLIIIAAGAGYYGYYNWDNIKVIFSNSDQQSENKTKAQAITNLFQIKSLNKTLFINSEPPGALIFINGKDTGKMTPTNIDVSGKVGEICNLVLKKDLYSDTTEGIVLNQQIPDTFNIMLQPLTKEVLIETQPPGAKITLDDETLEGETPIKVKLAFDKIYTLKLLMEGYYDKTLELNAKELEDTATYQLEVIPDPGFLIVKGSYPIDIYLGNRLLARSAINKKIEILPGNHNLTIVNEEIFLNRIINVQISSKQNTEFALPGIGKINIQAIRSNCKIYIDGKYLDYPPISDRNIVAGNHTIKCVWADGTEKIEKKEIIAGKSAYVRF